MHWLRATGLLCFVVLVLVCEASAFSFSQMELHHIFPRQYAGWFMERDINPDLFCLPLTRQKHTGKDTGIHHHTFMVSGGLSYNDSWGKFFIRNYPDASRNACFNFAATLLAEFGISATKATFYDYKTKNPSSEKFPRTGFLQKAAPLLNKVVKGAGTSLKTAAKYAPCLWTACEVFSFFSDMDDVYHVEYLEKALDFSEKALSLDMTASPEAVLEETAASYFFTGMFFYDNIRSHVGSMSGELALYMDSQKEEKLRRAIHAFEQTASIHERLGIQYPDVYLYLAQSYLLLKDKEPAVSYYRKALEAFRENNDMSMEESVRQPLNLLPGE